MLLPKMGDFLNCITRDPSPQRRQRNLPEGIAPPPPPPPPPSKRRTDELEDKDLLLRPPSAFWLKLQKRGNKPLREGREGGGGRMAAKLQFWDFVGFPHPVFSPPPLWLLFPRLFTLPSPSFSSVVGLLCPTKKGWGKRE